ncbi:NUDIX hydrolase [Streptomyces sp. NPDC056061]|uniref:NUDIX hydrolase n=1 Tax=Streptomyces sp. NPDC056061 TaxID=3345700 RepID=UPI0035DE4561
MSGTPASEGRAGGGTVRDHAGEPVGKRSANRPVLAAGCLLWRRSERSGALEVCLVHRPRYDDWSHPKGKLKRGESALDAARREVLEETGHHCAPGAALPTVRYLVNGRPKEVFYWAAEATGGSFVPCSEVDRVSWLAPEAARDRLTQQHDRDLLDAWLAAPPDARRPTPDA